ncbi:ABC transporter ATP-binding protein [Cytobacillus sp. Hm23]
MKQVLRASKYIFVCIMILTIILSFLPVAQLIITTKLINSLQGLLDVGIDTKKVLMLVGLQFGVLLIREVISRINTLLELILSQKLDFYLQNDLFQKLSAIDFVHFENADFVNHLERVQGDIGSRFLATITSSLEGIKSLFSFVSVLWFLFIMHWSLVFIPLLAVLPSLLIEAKFGKKNFFLMKFQTPLAREQAYIFNLFSKRNSNKEMRAYNTSEFLVKKWATSFKKNNREMVKLSISHHIRSILVSIYSFTILLVGTFILVMLYINKSIRLGDFVASLEAIQKAQASIGSLSMVVSSLASTHFYISDIRALFDLDEMSTERQLFPVMQKGVSVNNLSFAYPGTNKHVLKDISFNVGLGETVMIVGENGAGKSTLVKCLLGLYEGSQGTIKYDHIDINKINNKNIMDNISIIFQDFNQYEFTVNENITLSEKPVVSRVKEVSEQVGSDSFIDRLPNQYKSRLGRLFENSTDLSGGQWQKIALARALYKDSQIVILDEPTAALDPSAEYELFKSFKEISQDKMTFYISHRMYSCHLADKILVLKNGSLVECGSHEELMRKGGEYMELYLKQASMYEKEEKRKRAL